jgi:hypothetical protein
VQTGTNKKTARRAVFLFGAGNGTQTRDLCLGKASLYQLSYSRVITNRSRNYSCRIRLSTGKSFFMPAFMKKTLIKWSTIAVLGVSAYFLGYFWGVQNLGDESAPQAASETAPQRVPAGSQKPSELGELK